MGARSERLAEARADLRSLARWLQVRSNAPFVYKRWCDLDPSRRPLLQADYICQAAGELLRETGMLCCSCESIPHAEHCNIMQGLEWEMRMHDRWGLTKRSCSTRSMIPDQLKGVPYENEITSDADGVRVIPIRRASGG